MYLNCMSFVNECATTQLGKNVKARHSLTSSHELQAHAQPKMVSNEPRMHTIFCYLRKSVIILQVKDPLHVLAKLSV